MQNSGVMGPAYQAATPADAAVHAAQPCPAGCRPAPDAPRPAARAAAPGRSELGGRESAWEGSRGPRSPSRIVEGVKVTPPSRAPSLPETCTSKGWPSSSTWVRTSTPSSPMASSPPQAVGQRPVDLGLGQLDGPVGPVDGDLAGFAQQDLAGHPDAVEGELELGGVDPSGAGVRWRRRRWSRTSREKVGKNGKSRTWTTRNWPRSYSRWSASVTRPSKTRAAAKSAAAPSRSSTTTATRSLRIRRPGERGQQGHLGAVGDRGGRVAPALAVHQHAGVAEHGHEPVAEAFTELVQDRLEQGRWRLPQARPSRRAANSRI